MNKIDQMRKRFEAQKKKLLLKSHPLHHFYIKQLFGHEEKTGNTQRNNRSVFPLLSLGASRINLIGEQNEKDSLSTSSGQRTYDKKNINYKKPRVISLKAQSGRNKKMSLEPTQNIDQLTMRTIQPKDRISKNIQKNSNSISFCKKQQLSINNIDNNSTIIIVSKTPKKQSNTFKNIRIGNAKTLRNSWFKQEIKQVQSPTRKMSISGWKTQNQQQ